MKQSLQSKKLFLGMTGFSILFIIVGFLLISRVFDNYDMLVKQNVDSQLMRLTRAVDRSVESYLGRYVENLIHTTEHDDMQEAEILWLETGSEELWISKIRTGLLSSSEGFASVLLMDGDDILISTDKGQDYYFPEQEKSEGDITIRPCLGREGAVYLAFVRETERNLQYAALVDMRDFYQKVAGDIVVLQENQIMLLDIYGQMFVHKKNDTVHIDRVLDIKESDGEYEELCFMKAQQAQGESGTLLYDAASYSTGESYSARMVTIPAGAENNGFFSVGVSVNYDQEILPLKITAIRMAAAGGVLVLGIAFLLILLLQTMQKTQRTMQEIQILQEKNAAMEELNRRTQKLAHHQRLEIMGMLTSGIAHEFNNMLTPIMGYSMMILEKLPQDDTELYDEVLEIYQMSAKAKTVISRLSDLSRKNASTVFKMIPMDDLIRRMISAAKSARPNQVDIQLELKCPEVQILGNETQLSQLLLNLILNSYHALEEKGGTLEIITDAEEEYIYVTVRDNGYGISEANLPHIFDPFFTTKEAGKGTGLGMAIVAQVVEEHRGQIHVESVENEGTSITVKFPLSKNQSIEEE